MFQIRVDNEFRNSTGVIEYRWYKDDVTRFEAAWSAGEMPKYPNEDTKIYIWLNEKVVGRYYSKQEALGHVRKLLDKCPATCKKIFDEHSKVLVKALEG